MWQCYQGISVPRVMVRVVVISRVTLIFLLSCFVDSKLPNYNLRVFLSCEYVIKAFLFHVQWLETPFFTSVETAGGHKIKYSKSLFPLTQAFLQATEQDCEACRASNFSYLRGVFLILAATTWFLFFTLGYGVLEAWVWFGVWLLRAVGWGRVNVDKSHIPIKGGTRQTI